MAALRKLELTGRTRATVKWVLVALVLLGGAGLMAGYTWWDGSSPPDAAGLSAQRPLLYSVQRSTLEVIDPAQGAVLGRLSAPADASSIRAVARAGQALYGLTDKGLAIYSTDGHRLVAQAPRPDGRRLTVSPDGRTIAVSVIENPNVHLYRFDGKTITPGAQLPTGGEPGALLYSADGKTLYVGLDDAVLVLDAMSGKETNRFKLPKMHQKDPVRTLLRSPDGKVYGLYINADHLGALFRIDGAMTVHETGRVIHDIALSPDGDTLYATWRTAVPDIPRRGGLLILEPATFQPRRPEVPLEWAMGVAVPDDGRFIYVTEARRPLKWAFEFPGRLVQIDASSYEVIRRQPVDRLPMALHYR